ncbi:uncharacterized protein LOC113560765 [Rhopalosiphum maidis]|nr:uncharacterized protein LOC113547783 [Rhopalosiphum maidis]XP_026805019.1 uncharacterized protein LOC113548369 [Rhopalosiphum maidis]XP_026805020.1 uncharacterized protein LOC113548369 [Rhopalosiphum maidis]XP_026808841.1 uncharacterized protein LOC113551037 [Rhopalosiphum maidis]XP_026815314.1 uncharacterized protein LOC113555161 [Rhopalosiphum maidis]XP_026815827.1 uncharacterized protein LOC113555585 [Rhopalosiphum maidis]XP_026821352.1 uncharacterized protein LOC113559794 [Rhopalosiphu
MNNVIGDNFSDVKLQRANRVVPLDFAKKLTVCIRDDIFSIDPLLLFQRIMIRVKTDEELKECFEYELSPIPLSLFDESGQMRKSKKSILYDVFLTTTNTYNVLDKNVIVVIDGGFLLHRVVWPSTSTYGNIIENYISYVKRHYGSNCIVVFDGYANTELNIKNSERQRRKNMYTSTNIIFEESMDVLTTQEKFLSNTENKIRLITMLTEKFLTSGILVHQAEDDADLLIVNTAIRNTDDNIQVVVIGEDIDLLILLLTLSPPKNTIIFEKPGRGKIETRSYAVGSLQEHFKNEIQYFMFIHAVGGCDTTSSLFQTGKIKHLKTVQKHPELHDSLLIFNNESSSPEEIECAGEKYLLALYKAPAHITSLNNLRHHIFHKTAASNKKQVQLARLPPTIDAAREHLHRVYLQIQLWRGNRLNPQNWGWKEDNGKLNPVFTKKPPAPDTLLKVISCACAKTCEQNCSCRKAGLLCSVICKHCHGGSCLNQQPIIDDVEEDHIDDNFEDNIDEIFLIGNQKEETNTPTIKKIRPT